MIGGLGRPAGPGEALSPVRATRDWLPTLCSQRTTFSVSDPVQAGLPRPRPGRATAGVPDEAARPSGHRWPSGQRRRQQLLASRNGNINGRQ